MKSYSNKLIDFRDEPIFYGSGKNSQRYDILKYPFYDKLNNQMMGFDWTHDEIAVSKDKDDFSRLPDNMIHVITSVLQKLIFLDSIQGRGLLQTFGSYITLPEFEACVTTWQHFEVNKHSRSYTHILRSLYNNPSQIFDESFTIAPLKKLANNISYYYDQDMKDKENLLRLFIEINILEGIRFYSGFACIWSMHYTQGVMERTSKVLQLICRDENLHLALTQYTLNLLRKNDSEGFTKIYNKIKSNIPYIYQNACEQEFEWIDYLFSKGDFLGMSSIAAKEYIKYLCDKRLKAIKENAIYGVNKNPISWVNSYIDYDLLEQKPQESEIINYITNIVDFDIKEEEIKSLKDSLKYD